MYTEKLYYKDSHCFEFTALVLDCRETARGPALFWTGPPSSPRGAASWRIPAALGL